mgnify:CR=1 FL=1
MSESPWMWTACWFSMDVDPFQCPSSSLRCITYPALPGTLLLSCQAGQGLVTDRQDAACDLLAAEITAIDASIRNYAAERRAEDAAALQSGGEAELHRVREVRATTNRVPGDVACSLGGALRHFYDVKIVNSFTEASLADDVSSSNPLSGHTVGASLVRAAERKISKHAQDVAALGSAVFHPICISVFGYWDRTALADIFRLCAFTGPRRGVSPTAAAHAAGHGFLPGWAIAITGDMFYFAVLMVSTLWLNQLLGDERWTVGGMLIFMMVLPSIVRRWQERHEAKTGS